MKPKITLFPIPIIAILFLLAACGSTAPTATTTTPTMTATPTPMPAKTADQILSALKALGLPISDSFVYTADNDLNHLFGRPGQYIGKVNFKDSTVPVSQNSGANISVSDGGSIEIFASSGDASKRFAYLQSISKSGNALFAEYEYLEGNVVLRLSTTLTPTQAKAYDDQLKKMLG